MAQYNFQLRGWPAVIAVAAIAGFTGLKVYLRVRPVDDAMRDAVRVELVKEYSGRGPRDVTRILTEAHQGLPVESLPPLMQREVEFTSMAARGGSDGLVVRADVNVDGGAPPDGRAVRYFRVSRKFGGDGWMVVGESDAYRYFMELMPPAPRRHSSWW
jgi:hypothetical protein